MINYNDAVKSYDNTRRPDERIIEHFNKKINFNENMTVLDFGCGTGNYLNKIGNTFHCKAFGVEPSDGMIEKAQMKESSFIIKKGDHSNIPFDDLYFDFIYMTDVIHHIPDLSLLFSTLFKKLIPNGLLCIATESHQQIQSRWYNSYFPSLSVNEKKRYPDIDIIINSAKNYFILNEIEVLQHSKMKVIDKSFIQNVAEKNYSMFRMLDGNEYKIGLENLQREEGKEVPENSGDTLIWLKKKTHQTHMTNSG